MQVVPFSNTQYADDVCKSSAAMKVTPGFGDLNLKRFCGARITEWRPAA
jgi:hypothetical protein